MRKAWEPHVEDNVPKGGDIVTNAKTHVTSEYIACEARELLQLFTLRVDVDTAYIDR